MECNFLGFFWGVFFILFFLVFFGLFVGGVFLDEMFFVFLLIIDKLFIFCEVLIESFLFFCIFWFLGVWLGMCMFVIELDFVGSFLLVFSLLLLVLGFLFGLFWWCVVIWVIFCVWVNIGLVGVVSFIFLCKFFIMEDMVGELCMFLLLLVWFRSFFVFLGVGNDRGELKKN